MLQNKGERKKRMNEDISKFLDKIEIILKESGFDDYLWMLSMTCTQCKEHCKAIKSETNQILFECPACHYRWELEQKSLGHGKESEVLN